MPSKGESYYDDGPDEAPPAASKPSSEKPEGDAGEKTSILPREFFHGDVKPGDRCDIEVVAVHQEDVEVKCADSDEEEEPDEEAPEGDSAPDKSPMPGSMAEMME